MIDNLQEDLRREFGRILNSSCGLRESCQDDELMSELTMAHHQAKEAAKRPSTHPSVEDHDSQVRSLQSKQNSLGKALNEEQVGMTKKEGELQRARVEREEVENEDVDEDLVDGKA